MLQVGASLPVETKQSFQRDGYLLPAILIALAQQNCWRNDSSLKPSNFGGFRTIPTLYRIRLEVGNYDFNYSQLSGVLEN